MVGGGDCHWGESGGGAGSCTLGTISSAPSFWILWIRPCHKCICSCTNKNEKGQKHLLCLYRIHTYRSTLMSWGTACQTKLIKIKLSQNNCLRCIFFANKRESWPTPYLTLLEILKLDDIFKLKKLVPLDIKYNGSKKKHLLGCCIKFNVGRNC